MNTGAGRTGGVREKGLVCKCLLDRAPKTSTHPEMEAWCALVFTLSSAVDSIVYGSQRPAGPFNEAAFAIRKRAKPLEQTLLEPVAQSLEFRVRNLRLEFQSEIGSRI